MNNGPLVVLRPTLSWNMRNNLQDIFPKCGCLPVAFSICLALLSVCPEARGQLVITRGAARDVSVVNPIELLQGAPHHNVSLLEEERSELAEIVQAKPTLDLEIPFDLDSAILSPLARIQLEALGRALSSPALKDMTFVIAGHTDSLEEESYSQRLAERRAEAVKRELVKSFNIPKENLVAVGYGSSKLKISMNPFALQNNRVQVVNMDVAKH
jgi:outer membrane protein OmpA-like peptidoglycan-associated protein